MINGRLTRVWTMIREKRIVVILNVETFLFYTSEVHFVAMKQEHIVQT